MSFASLQQVTSRFTTADQVLERSQIRHLAFVGHLSVGGRGQNSCIIDLLFASEMCFSHQIYPIISDSILLNVSEAKAVMIHLRPEFDRSESLW